MVLIPIPSFPRPYLGFRLWLKKHLIFVRSQPLICYQLVPFSLIQYGAADSGPKHSLKYLSISDWLKSLGLFFITSYIYSYGSNLEPRRLRYLINWHQYYLSNRPHLLWVYRRDNPLGMLGEHSCGLLLNETEIHFCK